MRFQALETRIDEFDERNLVLQLALGLLSAADTLDSVLERTVPSEEPASVPVLHEEDRQLILFVLGLISFRETIGGLARGSANGTAPEKSVAEADSSAFFRGALR